jgi:hypothetical protein
MYRNYMGYGLPETCKTEFSAQQAGRMHCWAQDVLRSWMVCTPTAATETPGITCRDGVDNDCDGFTDCEDPDCGSDPGCFCADNGGNSPLVCVDWAGGLPPQSDQDFHIDFVTDASNPGVEFRTGNNGWKVWSQISRTNSTPANLGHIRIDPTLPTSNFSAKIAHGPLPGAANVASIELVKSGWTGHSNIASGSIVGSLHGDLAVQDSNGQGGLVYLTIDDLDGDLTIPKLRVLEVKGAVSANSTVTVHDFAIERRAEFNTAGGSFAGDLLLPNGLALTSMLAIHGHLTDTALVHVASGTSSLQGSVSFYGGSSPASVINMGILRSRFNLFGATYLGAANMQSITGQSTITIEGATLNGQINVNGNWGGRLNLVDGIFGPQALVSIGDELTTSASLNFYPQPGGMSGDILIGRNCNGAIRIHNESMAGEIHIGSVMNGSLCAGNFSATQPLPSNVTIGCGIGADGTICGQEPVCPAGDILSSLAWPPHGTKDARRPYPMGPDGSAVPLSARQGIGSPNPDACEEDTIRMTLDNSGLRAISHDCWALCETGIEQVDAGTPPLSANRISCVAEPAVGGSEYEIELERPISAGHWTTLRYAPGTTPVIYASLPGNSNGDRYNTALDILKHIDCCVNQIPICTPPYGNYSCDIDHDGSWTSYDTTALIDLFNGVGTFIPWYGKVLPLNSCIGEKAGGGAGGGICPDASCGGEDPGPMSMTMGGPGEGFEESSLEADSSEFVEDENAVFSAWVVDFLTEADPQGDHATLVFHESVQLITQWCVSNFGDEEKEALASLLADPGLNFASRVGADAAAVVLETITQ